jgi:sporulation protein YlmC with PRC-barrel domain
MKRLTLACSVAAGVCLGLATPLFAAPPPVTGTVSHPSPGGTSASTTKPAEKCLTDLRAFNSQMEKDGYWLGGFGYPMVGLLPGTATSYQSARSGYEVRTLVAAANILARQGQQQACENVLATTSGIYKLYVADMRSGHMPPVDVAGWQQQQVAAAQPVKGMDTSFRSEQLLGIDVLDPQDNELGSVNDLVMSPATGKIAYLVIARGGIFGFDQAYVPVPWSDFKITPNASLLVLNTTKATMDAAPRVAYDKFTTPGHFDQQSQKVDDYWKTHLTN